MKYSSTGLWLCGFLALSACNSVDSLESHQLDIIYPSNVLDYSGSPQSPKDRSTLSWSDQGAWFSYGFPDFKEEKSIGFAGPFLMTEANGIWSSSCLTSIQLNVGDSLLPLDCTNAAIQQNSYLSHLYQSIETNKVLVEQYLVFQSAQVAIIHTSINNLTNESLVIQPVIQGNSWLDNAHFESKIEGIKIDFDHNQSEGLIDFKVAQFARLVVEDKHFEAQLEKQTIPPEGNIQLTFTHSFWFSDSSNPNTQKVDASRILEKRKAEKSDQVAKLQAKLRKEFSDSTYQTLLIKTAQTLQNNWRQGAGELNHDGLFPSYHYIWFHGFWAWDSWKHAAAVSQFNPTIAKEQILAMYDYQEDNGFIPDCIFRDTTIEKHNYRNSKPPLSGWAIWETFEKSKDIEFLEEIYPKLLKQHNWWYTYRDIDHDGICEYGSTDGTLIAAKWDSGMDNAVRFDESEILKIKDGVFVINQESVDLNAYLFAEKNFICKMAKVLNDSLSIEKYSAEKDSLKIKIQNQFFDQQTGWFYDTTVDGTDFIQVMGCEGWIPLWAEVSTDSQAAQVLENMVDTTKFNTYVPLPTLSADHQKFEPNGGYWRGPNWIDQCYFGVRGLQKYGYKKEAYELSKKLLHNPKGLITPGPSIRENYHPLTGEGLESENFSWSAGHFMMLLLSRDTLKN